MNAIFQALADPTRRKILKMLRASDLNAGEIAAKFAMTKPSVSHHLSVLRNAGLVLSEKQGQNVVYSLNATVFQEVMEYFFDLLQRGDGSENK